MRDESNIFVIGLDMEDQTPEMIAREAALISNGMYKPDLLTAYLEEIRETVKFKKWFFGHYHDNRNVNTEEILLWEQIIRIS